MSSKDIYNMLHNSNKATKNAILVLFSKSNLQALTILNNEEKKIIQSKLKEDLKIIQLQKDYKTYIFLAIDESNNLNQQQENLRIQGNAIYNTCKNFKESAIQLEATEGVNKAAIAAILLGIELSNYEFNKYLSKKKSYQLDVFISSTIIDKNTIDEINLLSESVHLTKDLVNEPVSYLTATQYAKDIQQLGKNAGFKVTVWNQKKIEQEKMGGLIAVNRGSSAPAAFIILEYKPTKSINKKPLVLVGKGVVYDTGGLSLKPTKNSMDMMKCDMAGSAAVVGAMFAIAKAKLPYHIIGLIPAVENRPGYEATCPGDIITMYSGTTVEVMDTDAEGRLILADALHYAKRLKPELVLDFATLTGSAMRAIGKEASVIMGTADDNTKKEITDAANATGERVVEFPLWEEYAEYMKSDIADLKNLGPVDAGSITAGKFLEHFTDYPWMHFDIAGPAYVSGAYNYRGKWATAYGVRLLFKFVQNKCEHVNR
ncbi:MAG: hypothetical protein RJA25_709 [Bacteroidota bacterium]